jgi:hypothetical protein
VLDNQYFTVPTGLTEDRRVAAMEIRPGDRRVLHHATVFLVGGKLTAEDDPPGVPCRDAEYAVQRIAQQRTLMQRGGALGRRYLFSWTPGASAFVAPAGGARRIPAGAQLVFEMHYVPDGAATTDRTRIGFVWQRGKVTIRLESVTVAQPNLEIPPGAPAHPVSACYYFARPMRLLSIKPHMHLRGRDVAFSVRAPDGRVTPLLSVPRWDFDWQLTYVLAAPLLLDRGARIEVTAHYDNSAGNPRNPDPTRVITWDEFSSGEMLAGMMTLAAVDEAP